MKTLQNLRSAKSTLMVLALALLTLASCRKSDDVTPMASQSSSVDAGTVSASGQVTLTGTITEGINAPNGPLYVLVSADGTASTLHSSKINLGTYLFKAVTASGRNTTKQGVTYVEITSITAL